MKVDRLVANEQVYWFQHVSLFQIVEEVGESDLIELSTDLFQLDIPPIPNSHLESWSKSHFRHWSWFSQLTIRNSQIHKGIFSVLQFHSLNQLD